MWQRLDFGPQETADRLADVNDVNAVFPGVDVRRHLRIPTAGAMPEMHARLNQLVHQSLRHANAPFSGLAMTPRIDADTTGWTFAK
jgi:hypothetical protein